MSDSICLRCARSGRRRKYCQDCHNIQEPTLYQKVQKARETLAKPSIHQLVEQKKFQDLLRGLHLRSLT